MATMRTNPNRLMTLLLVLELVMVAHGQTHNSTICNHSGVGLMCNNKPLSNGDCRTMPVDGQLAIVQKTGPSSNPSILYPLDVTLANIVSNGNCLIVIVLGVTPVSTTFTQILQILGVLCILVPTPPDHNSLTGHGYASLPGSLTGHEEYANLKGSLTGQEKYASLEGVAGM